MAPNRFISLASDNSDDSDTDIELTGPTITEKTGEDASADSDQSVYFDALEAEDDASYFLQEVSPKKGVETCRAFRFLQDPRSLANKLLPVYFCDHYSNGPCAN